MDCGTRSMRPTAPRVYIQKISWSTWTRSTPGCAVILTVGRGRKKDEVTGSQDGRAGLTEGMAPDGMSSCLIYVFKVTRQTCPWFGLAVKPNEIQYGRPVTRERPGSLRERLARVWIRVRTYVSVGTWKAWQAMVKEAGDQSRGVNDDNSLRLSDFWASPNAEGPCWGSLCDSGSISGVELRQLMSCLWSDWPGSRRCPAQETDGRAKI